MKDNPNAEIVEQWRSGADDSPAGPLFASGPFAEADITTAGCGITTCGTQCSASPTRTCC